MQVTKQDDSFDLTDYEDIFVEHSSYQEALLKALMREEVKSVTFHKPGSKVKDKKGIVHQVQKDGSWKRIRGNRGGK